MKFKRKPEEIEAMQWTGENIDKIKCFANGHVVQSIDSSWLLVTSAMGNQCLVKDDWIIRGREGNFSLCKPSVFEQIYEAI